MLMPEEINRKVEEYKRGKKEVQRLESEIIADCMKRLEEYQKTGKQPHEIRKMSEAAELYDKMYLEKCREVTKLRKMAKNQNAEPVIITGHNHAIGTDTGQCPVCGEMLRECWNRYCHNCGKKLEWSGKEQNHTQGSSQEMKKPEKSKFTNNRERGGENRRKKRIYISGPVTGTDDYTERFAKAQADLTERGYSVINPVLVNSNMPEDATWEEYMKMSFCMLEMCDTIFMLNGWEKSKGAVLEFRKAINRNMAVIMEI